LSIGARIFGTLAGLFVLFLLVGLLLPGSWEAQAEAAFPAPPETVFHFLERPDQWTLWMTLPSSGVQSFGPPKGPGAGIRWNDPQYGEGEFRILGSGRASEETARILYEVVLEGGSIRIRGFLTLSPEDGGTRLQWQEHGQFGRNPLLGYAARGMARSQGEAMRTSLKNLREVLVVDRSPIHAPGTGREPREPLSVP
jgi:uncharacterized protein YndB with AHSA1/START domain